MHSRYDEWAGNNSPGEAMSIVHLCPVIRLSFSVFLPSNKLVLMVFLVFMWNSLIMHMYYAVLEIDLDSSEVLCTCFLFPHVFFSLSQSNLSHPECWWVLYDHGSSHARNVGWLHYERWWLDQGMTCSAFNSCLCVLSGISGHHNVSASYDAVLCLLTWMVHSLVCICWFLNSACIRPSGPYTEGCEGCGRIPPQEFWSTFSRDCMALCPLESLIYRVNMR